MNVKTITIDNGIEFEKIGLLASWLKCKIYFCEPYASYQRGTNEHSNGLIRRIYKKGADFSTISDKEILEIQEKINNMPRKIFNWMSSYENKKIIKDDDE
ncbi:IS30 family transposase [Mesomycoplasma lagogenitalium]|uniref:IS30 family transposase n=1 Tax=Mesomycoplasma lagogenitalium TaxID=171286 RepID=UPI002962185F|nr:IS30 family transposase [Mesomycoplasma lagogenitalium]